MGKRKRDRDEEENIYPNSLGDKRGKPRYPGDLGRRETGDTRYGHPALVPPRQRPGWRGWDY